MSRLNIVVVPDIDRAEAHYEGVTPNGKLWAYIIMGDTSIVPNKDSRAGLQTEQRGGIENLYSQTAFSIVVVWPRGSDEHMSTQLEEAHSDIYNAMYRTFYGAKVTGYTIAPLSSGMSQLKNSAQYAHAYEFVATEKLDSLQDGIAIGDLEYSVPIRDIDFGLFIDVGDKPQEIGSLINVDG